MTGGTTGGTGVCISFCVRQLVTIFAFTSTPASKIHTILVYLSIPLPEFQMNSSPIHPGLKEIFINWCFSCSLKTAHGILLVYLSWFGLRDQGRCVIQETRMKAPKPMTCVYFNDASSTESRNEISTSRVCSDIENLTEKLKTLITKNPSDLQQPYSPLNCSFSPFV